VSLTAAGRLFHARDAATGNERSPRVDRRVDGTNSVGDAARVKSRVTVVVTVTQLLTLGIFTSEGIKIVMIINK